MQAKAKPRKRNAAKTRAQILDAAQRLFSNKDYSQAKISEIAADAGVNQALVIRYFHSKEKLFETALIAAIEHRWKEADARVDRSRFGERVVDQMIDDERFFANPLAMTFHASSNPRTRAIATALVEAHLVTSLAEWLGEGPAAVRATQVLAMCAGLFTFRRLLPLDPFQDDCDPELRSWFAATIQAVVENDPAGVGGG